jgi:hypothetical protein
MCPVPPDDDRLTARQQAALSSIEAAHPCPVTTAELAAELLVAEGASRCARCKADD